MQDQPTGFCQCGCGEATALARQTDTRRGHTKGQPVPWLKGHNTRIHPGTGRPKLSGPEYLVQDRGFETPCWIWQHSLNDQGYGMAGNARAHRVMYEGNVGPIPDDLELDHLCRNRACVNPAHLEAVTHQENIRRAGHVRLTVESAAWIKTLAAMGFRVLDISRYYEVPRTTVAHVVDGKTWADVQPIEIGCVY